MPNEDAIKSARSLRDLKNALEAKPEVAVQPVLAQRSKPTTQQQSGIAVGLKRISAVWWTLCALVVGGVGVALLFESHSGPRGVAFMLIAGAILGAFFLHSITCWIIDGFSGRAE